MHLPPEVLAILLEAHLSPEQLAVVKRAMVILVGPVEEWRAQARARQARRYLKKKLTSVSREPHVSLTLEQSNNINGSRVEDNNTLPFLLPSNSVNNSETPTPGVRVVASKKSTRPQRLPEGWQPSDEDREKLISEGATSRQLDFALKAMTDWAEAKGITRASWPATYRGFVRRDLERQSAGGFNGQGKRPVKLGSVVDIGNEIIADLNAIRERQRRSGPGSS